MSKDQSGAVRTVSGRPGGAVERLMQDHREIEGLFDDYARPTRDGERKQALIERICSALVVHTILEEEIFYAICREAFDDLAELDLAQVEHDSAKMLIADLQQGDDRDEFRVAKLQVLEREIRQHIAEEERPETGVLAQALAIGLDTPALAERLEARKAELKAEPPGLPPTRPVTFDVRPGAFQRRHRDTEEPRPFDEDGPHDHRSRGETRL